MMSEILHLHFWQQPFYRFISTISQESRDFRMYSIWHTGDMQCPLQPCLQHLQDRYLEPLQIQKAIKNQFLQLHLESGQLLQLLWDLQSTGWPFW